MTRALLIRHAHHALVGKALAGRNDQVSLTGEGRAQAHSLAQQLRGLAIAAIYTSPQRRARESAAPLAAALTLDCRVETGLDEVDFGAWTGKSFETLADHPQWPVWCERRSLAQPPGGERIADAQRRAVDALSRITRRHPREAIALFSHGDVIKTILAHVLRVSLDDLERFHVAAPSVSIVDVEGDWMRVACINAVSEL